MKVGDILICKISYNDLTKGKSYEIISMNNSIIIIITDKDRCGYSKNSLSNYFYTKEELRLLKLNSI